MTEVITSQAIAFSFPIKPNFSVVFPLIFIWLDDISQIFEIDWIILFLSFEQQEDIEIAKFLSIEYWTTIVIYKNNKEVYRSIGQTDKSKIYSTISNLS